MKTKVANLLKELYLDPADLTVGNLDVTTPINGEFIGSVGTDIPSSVTHKIEQSVEAFKAWRSLPAPRRGELVRLLGDELRTHKDALGALVSAECGKILEEGKGEVQEMIDICEFAVGLSRAINGQTIPSERPGHHMREYWQPIGPVGIISAFNFPVAVWSWNAALALICGDSIIWKPSEKTPLTALACQALLERAIAKFGDDAPANLSQVIIGHADVGETMVDDERMALISATGSTRMGRAVGPRVAARFGKCLLELGGNNAIIVAPTADLDMAIPGIVFGAVGTAGQRCTSTRRLIVHDSVYDNLVPRLKKAYESISIGDPLSGALVGPLIDKDSFDAMQRALDAAKAEGGAVFGGEKVTVEGCEGGYYAKPAIVEMPAQSESVCEETFAPILYIMKYSEFEEAMTMQNDVPQGLSSSIFTNDMREAEMFICSSGSDCGIANVNIGTSGAEIGGAFGGEKETGGGRESGSDAWKAYMRRQTSTVNYSRELPLAQGIKFDI
ncbi:aldehyde dehydrogenase family protein [Temperatibacter marinus]|uniref:aldehyde dehydrogenase (NAD(+)) n=1 Tax=Temperatibacter marinus TaxID=1456591 RepID=A0AA52EAD6_9PROT|nr:aldehyde dehydrogenase family protein [Temperatibacter marinus]WND01652.1 aldehyde dehydrogenase family protein [Temperatibacter marinus]